MKIEEAMTLHTKHLLRLAYFYRKNHQSSEDIVQDVFIQFYRANYEEQGTLKAFLSKMTINKCKDYLKSWHYRKMQITDFLEEKSTRSKDSLVVSEEQLTIGQAILTLSIKYREVIILYYFEELTLVQIAELLNMPINTVKTRLKRAKEQLRPLLQDEWEVLHDGSY